MSKEKKNSPPWQLIVVFLILMLVAILSFIPCIRVIVTKNILGLSGNSINRDFYNILIASFGVVGLIGNFWLYYKRLVNQNQLISEQQKQNKNQQFQIRLQRKANIDQRFALAVETLGNSEESARTGAIYSLYHLAMEPADSDNKYRQTVIDILCSHIRSKTREQQYIDRYFNRKPSNEVQTTLNLLFKENGIYYKFNRILNNPDLSNSNLNYSDFSNTRCREVLFTNVYLMDSDFKNSNIIKADFSFSHLESSIFDNAVSKGTKFDHSFLNNAKFYKSNLFYATFKDTKCIGTSFLGSMMQFTVFTYSYCQAADFTSVRAEGSNFIYTGFQNATFFRTHLQGSNLGLAHLQGCDIKHLYLQGAWSDAMNSYNAKTLIYELIPKLLLKKFKERIEKNTDISKTIFSGPIISEVEEYILKERSESLYNNDKYYKMKIDELIVTINKNKRRKSSSIPPKGVIIGVLSLKEFPNIIHLLSNHISQYIKNCVYENDEIWVKDKIIQ